MVSYPILEVVAGTSYPVEAVAGASYLVEVVAGALYTVRAEVGASYTVEVAVVVAIFPLKENQVKVVEAVRVWGFLKMMEVLKKGVVKSVVAVGL